MKSEIKHFLFCMYVLGGKFMKFDCATLSKIDKAPMRNHSSTDELLTIWGQQNHTILELFIILNKMQHYQAMTILKPFGIHLYNNFTFLFCSYYLLFSYF